MESRSQLFLKIINSLINLLLEILLLIAAAYALFALWDNQNVYSAAQNVQQSMRELKPTADPADREEKFKALKKINPDVCAWVELDNTNIDYPVLIGEDNLTYINTDVYGNFALAGSIYLDAYCDPEFQDRYFLLYGHHMENSEMFGDLDKYKQEEFFDSNDSGQLLLPDSSYRLKIFACMVVYASDSIIFHTTDWKEDVSGLLEYVNTNARFCRRQVIQEINRKGWKVLALSTCASDDTDARTIVLAAMIPQD